jgi:D-alanine-D-alanine ligase-like ATP-grasp enzyme
MSERTVHTCSACGTAPINHALAKSLSVADELLHYLDKVFAGVVDKKLWQQSAIGLEKLLFGLSRFMRISSFNRDDTEKSLNGRSKIIWEEARRRNIPMEQILMFGKPTDYFRAHLRGGFFYFNSLPIPPEIPQSGYKWVDNKLRLAKELTAVGICAPQTIPAKTLSEAKKAFEVLQKPLIIKPEFGSRGRHTTTNINTLEELEKAYHLAKKIAMSVVVQEHLVGSVYRATVIDGKMVGFYRADQPYVEGDGVRTVRDLIEAKNISRRERVSEVIINKDLEDFIGRKGYTLDSILPTGEVLHLSAKTGRMYGSYTKEMLPEVHPNMHRIFEHAGRVCNAPVLGFDLIMEDATKDPSSQRWGIIECNSLPFIDLHYMALEGEPIDLAKNVWDLWEKGEVKIAK